MLRVLEVQARGNIGDPTVHSGRYVLRVGTAGKTLASPAEDSVLLGSQPQEAHSRCWRGRSLGERPASREQGGPLVPGSWERGKASKGTIAREFGEGREGSHEDSERRTGGLGESSIQRPSSKLEPGSAIRDQEIPHSNPLRKPRPRRGV